MKIAIISFAVLFFLGLGSVFTVNQNEQALVLQFGNPIKVVNAPAAGKAEEPGLKFKLPYFFEDVIKFDKRVLDFDLDAKEVIASDQKRLIVDAFAKYKIVDPLKFYQTVRDERGIQSRLNSILDSRLREVLGSVPLSTLLTGERATIMRNIKNNVNKELASFGVDVVDVRIMRADLPEANSQAIFRRMQTEREREAKEFRSQGDEQALRIKSTAEKDRTVLIAEAEKKSQTLRGEGDALATKIYADAFNRDPEFFAFYRSMQAYRATMTKDDTTVVLSPGSEYLKYFGGP